MEFVCVWFLWWSWSWEWCCGVLVSVLEVSGVWDGGRRGGDGEGE